MERKCLECGEKLHGRVDKKFCSDQCRNTYNNKEKRPVNNMVRNINNILSKNRRILEELNPTDKVTVHRDKLTSRGFDFKYHTGTYVTKKGSTYFFCYEHGYLALSNGFYALVVRKDKETTQQGKK